MEDKKYVYAIHEGSQWEGGGVSEIYGEKEKAIKFALMKVEEKKQNDAELNKETWPYYKPWEKLEYESNEFFIMGWANYIEEVCIYKYEVL
jgi:hypothetical protein